MIGTMPCGCGQCLPCRINKRRLWTFRIFLETQMHDDSSFVTLTYDQGHLPQDGTVDPRETRDWIKRIREAVRPRKIRYFLVGEYGDRTQRPHYHVALFGYRSCVRGRTEHRLARCCQQCDLVRETWKRGGIDVGSVNMESAGYIGGYVTKKMTKKTDDRLNGRHPEFARMSLKPGIGAEAMDKVKEVCQNAINKGMLDRDGDVPYSLNLGRGAFPLGRYLRRKLREKMGRSPDPPPGEKERFGLEMRFLLEEILAEKGWQDTSISGIWKKENEGKVRSLEAKFKIHNNGGSL